MFNAKQKKKSWRPGEGSWDGEIHKLHHIEFKTLISWNLMKKQKFSILKI